MIVQTDVDKGSHTVIDAKFPLPWLIGCSATIVFCLGGVFVQINSVAATVAKIETKTDIRDERSNVMAQTIIALQGDQRTQDAKIDRSAADIVEVKRDIEEMKRKQTWAPK
jgi:hypothetical protein